MIVKKLKGGFSATETLENWSHPLSKTTQYSIRSRKEWNQVLSYVILLYVQMHLYFRDRKEEKHPQEIPNRIQISSSKFGINKYSTQQYKIIITNKKGQPASSSPHLVKVLGKGIY